MADLTFAGGMTRRIKPEPVAATTAHVSAATGANSAAVVTLTTNAAQGHVIEFVVVSFTGPSVSSSLTISDGTDTHFNQKVAGAEWPKAIPVQLIFAKNTQVTGTLAAGGVGLTGTVTVHTYTVA